MEGIKIFSDSTCDLPMEEVNRMNIGIIPLTINFGEEVYKGNGRNKNIFR